jgi:hypothetical protein
MIVVPNKVTNIEQFHEWLQDRGLFRAYEDGRDLSIQLNSGFGDQVHTSEQFWLRYYRPFCFEIYRNENYMVKVWDSRISDAKVLYDGKYGAERAGGQIQQALIEIAEECLRTDSFGRYDFTGDRVNMYVLTEIVS